MKNKEIYKYLMHMEEVIYDLKRSIDRMRNIHPIKQDSIVPNNPFGIPNELAVKTGLDRAVLTPNAIRDILGEVTNKIAQSIDKAMMEDITPPKRTMKDVKVGDKVRYERQVLIDGVDWAYRACMTIGNVYTVYSVLIDSAPEMRLVDVPYWHPKECFELI